MVNCNIARFADTAIGFTGDSSNSIAAGNLIKARQAHGTLGIIVEEDAEHTIISNNVLDGSWDGQPFESADYKDVGGLTTGIRLSDNKTGTSPLNTIVQGNLVHDVKMYGIMTLNAVDGENTRYALISGNSVHRSGKQNFRLQDLDDSMVSGNMSTETPIYMWSRNLRNVTIASNFVVGTPVQFDPN